MRQVFKKIDWIIEWIENILCGGTLLGIVCITGADMKTIASGYLQTLFEANATAIGDAMPGDDFYYGA